MGYNYKFGIKQTKKSTKLYMEMKFIRMVSMD
jgi:hypothetical protein